MLIQVKEKIINSRSRNAESDTTDHYLKTISKYIIAHAEILFFKWATLNINVLLSQWLRKIKTLK